MSSPPTSPSQSRPRRESRFTEGSETTLSSSETYTTPLTLQTILSEMDAHERALSRRGGSSSSSVDSFSSPTAMGSRTREERNFSSRRSEDVGRGFGGHRGSGTWGTEGEGLASKVKGRLRAFTVGERRRERVKGSPYPGT